jgi:hypothetical protein
MGVQGPGLCPGVEPGIERGRSLTARGHGSNQSYCHVGVRRPGFDIGLVGHCGGHHLGPRANHVPQHGAAHAANFLEPRRGATGCRLHICSNDRTIRASSLHGCEIDPQFLR